MRKFNPTIEIIIAAIIWGSNGAFIKWLDLPSEIIIFFRSMSPVLFALVFIIIFTKINLFRGNKKMVLIASTINAIRIFLFTYAMLHTSMANAVIILYTWPAFAIIYSHFLLNERLTTKDYICTALSFCGIITVFINHDFSFSNDDMLGMGAMLLHSMIYPLTVIIFKKEAAKYTPTEKILYQNLIAAIIFTPFLFILPDFPTLEQFGIGISYGLLVGTFGFILFFSALSKINASKASLLCYMEVPSAIIFGIVLFGETVTFNMILGASMIIGSSIYVQYKKTNDK